MTNLIAFLAAHKAQIATLAGILAAAAVATPPPYNAVLTAVAITLATLTGGPPPTGRPSK